MRLISWNMAHLETNWRHISADAHLDVALLQEAVPPPRGIASQTIPSMDDEWVTARGGRRFCAAIARMSDRVTMRPIKTKLLADAGPDDLGVSLPGTLAACELTEQGGEPITLASIYGAWSSPVPGNKNGWIYADASVHRVISDLSALLASQRGHRIVVAGDLNILHGQGEHGSDYWKARYETVFARMAAIGLPLVGPQHPNGEQCWPWPTELPTDSKNVPTFRTQKADPASATRQLDFVFASKDLAERIRVRACNGAAEWGPSDHCRLEIELDSAKNLSGQIATSPWTTHPTSG
jgi:exonuclease III